MISTANTPSNLTSTGNLSTLVTDTAALTTTTTAAGAVSGFESDSIWTINFNTLFLLERQDVCIQCAFDRVGALGADILHVLFSPSKTLVMNNNQACDSVDSTIKLTFIQITSEVNLYRQSPSYNSKSLTTTGSPEVVDRLLIKSTVEKMCVDNPQFLVKDLFFDQYSVNIRSIIDYIRQQTLNKVLADRYHPYASRIVQLLLSKRYLEQQSISDMVIAPPRDVRLRIYELYKHGWIDLHEVCKKTDFSPASTQFFWFTTQAQIMTTLLESLYISIFNVKVRRQCEFEKGENLLEFSENGRAELQQQIKVFQGVMRRLDSSMYKIDKTLILCSRF